MCHILKKYYTNMQIYCVSVNLRVTLSQYSIALEQFNKYKYSNTHWQAADAVYMCVCREPCFRNSCFLIMSRSEFLGLRSLDRCLVNAFSEMRWIINLASPDATCMRGGRHEWMKMLSLAILTRRPNYIIYFLPPVEKRLVRYNYPKLTQLFSFISS